MDERVKDEGLLEGAKEAYTVEESRSEPGRQAERNNQSQSSTEY